MIRYTIFLLLFLYAIIFICCGQRKTAVPDDPAIKVDTLPNGFTYYVGHNDNPENTIYLYFCVKAGSLSEDSDQPDVAHLIEHLAFTDCKNYPDPFRTFERYGVQRGPGFNAYTDYRMTVFQMKIPSNDENLLMESLRFLRDVAKNIQMTPSKVDKERTVVIAEINRTPESVRRNDYVKYLLKGTSYKSRYEQDTRQGLLKFKQSAAERFYSDWYRSDNESIIIVGDINIPKIIPSVKEIFGDLPHRGSKRLMPEDTLSLSGVNDYIILTDEEIHQTELRVYTKHPSRKLLTINDYKHSLLHELYNIAIDNRLDRLRTLPGSPINKVQHSIDDHLGGIYNCGLFAVSTFIQPVSNIRAALVSVFRELACVRNMGFTEEELANAIKTYWRNTNNGPSTSENIVDRCLNNYVFGKAMPSSHYIDSLKTMLIGQLSIDDLNKECRTLLADSNISVVVTAPSRERNNLPGRDSVFNWISYNHYALDSGLTSINRNFILAPKFENIKECSSTSSTQLRVSDYNLTTIKLSNGIEITLKPVKNLHETEDASGILFQAFSPTTQRPGLDTATNVSQTVIEGVLKAGICGLSQKELNRFLEKNDMNLYPYFLSHNYGLEGRFFKRDMDVFIKIVSSYFKLALQDTISLSKLFAGMDQGIDSSTDRNSQAVCYKYANIYKLLFGNAANFKFIFTGDFDLDSLKKAVEKELSCLPVGLLIKTKHVTKDAKSTRLSAPASTISFKGNEMTASIYLKFEHFPPGEETDKTKLRLMAKMLQSQLTNRLRFTEGATYSVTVHDMFNQTKGTSLLSIYFLTDPKFAKKYARMAIEEVLKFVKQGPDKNTFEEIIGIEVSSFHSDLQNNRFWLQYIKEQLFQNGNFNSINQRENVYRQVTISQIQTLAFEIINLRHLSQTIVYPGNMKTREAVF